MYGMSVGLRLPSVREPQESLVCRPFRPLPTARVIPPPHLVHPDPGNLETEVIMWRGGYCLIPFNDQGFRKYQVQGPQIYTGNVLITQKDFVLVDAVDRVSVSQLILVII